MRFHAMVIFGLGKDLLFKSVTPLHAVSDYKKRWSVVSAGVS